MITNQKKIKVFMQTEKGQKIIEDLLATYAGYCKITGKRILDSPSLYVESWDFIGWGCCSYLTVTNISRGRLRLRKSTTILTFRREPGPLSTCKWKITYINYDKLAEIRVASNLLQQNTQIAEREINVFKDDLDGQLEPSR